MSRGKQKKKGLSKAKKLMLCMCIALVLMMGVGSSFAYIITSSPTLQNLFTNGMEPDGDLIIQKSVSHTYGESYLLPDDLAFTFDVDLGDDYAKKSVKTTQGKLTADENGIVTVTVPANGRTTVYDIDENTEVTVTETDIGHGFTADVPSETLVIEKYKDNIVSVTNTYLADSAKTEQLTLAGKKRLVGRDWQEGDSFTFRLDVLENGTWTSLGSETVTYELEAQQDPENPENTIYVPKTGYDQFDFTSLIQSYNFGKAGSYTFRVIETQGTIGGITYDPTEARFDVEITDTDMDGYLEIQSVTTASGNTNVSGTDVYILFENSYAPAGSAEARIDIVKTVEDNSGQEKTPAGYTFELYDAGVSDSLEAVAVSAPTDANGETSIRLVYTPEDAGKTFSYVLKETNGGTTANGMTYDDTSHVFYVDVIDNWDGTVSTSVYDATGYGNTNEAYVYETSFVNEYDPADGYVILSGSKTLEGREMKANEFTFELYETEADFAVAESAVPIDTAENEADGDFAFEQQNYAQVGTYYYVVTENDDDQLGGITYDDCRYLITVTVTDDNGQLLADPKITDIYGETAELSFANTYEPQPVTLTLKGVKTLEGGTLQEGDFRFDLYVADEEFLSSEEPFQTAENDAYGNFTFEELEFTADGTYYYVVTEDDSDVEIGMTYDDTIYCIAVEVEDEGKGELEIEKVKMTADGETVTEIRFENIYDDPNKPDEPDTPDTPDEPDDPDEPDVPSSEPSEPDTPDEPSTPGEDSDGAQTGDDSNITPYVILMILSGAGLILAVIFVIRRKNR